MGGRAEISSQHPRLFWPDLPSGREGSRDFFPALAVRVREAAWHLLREARLQPAVREEGAPGPGLSLPV